MDNILSEVSISDGKFDKLEPVDDSLINAVDYWKHQGISIEFLPYRIYELDGKNYFEFFALPYDKHKNPSSV